ncbi:NUDIX domain-containing protein [Phenylobacterium sp.]|uniref:NUDIX hydrolase n=1 Tax=Phenylobacterium sp. TaxID=1871053 RepID=UPI0025FCA987|nr:NUDIX domain-containing protein [Phenylobacterium sp.]
MKKHASATPVRPTARVLLLDRDDRILLMKGRLPGRPPGHGAWFTIGGGVEAGETYLEAAAREIREETGIAEFELGPAVWLREGVLGIPEPTLFREQYIVARCHGAEPSRAGWNALERDLIDDIRWWTVQALTTTQEPVFPPGLARLPRVLAGDLPAEPRRIPWD